MAFPTTITTARARGTASARAAGVPFLVLAAGFLVVITLGPSMAPGYDYAGGAISDLGTVPETALLFNLALVAVGVLNALGGVLLWRATRRSGVLLPFLVAGVGAAGAGLFPLDSGGPHGLFALVAFLAFNLQALAAATIVRGALRVAAVVAGVAGLVFVVLMVLGDGGIAAAFGPIGHGGTERMIVYPVMLWMLALAGYLLGGGAGER